MASVNSELTAYPIDAENANEMNRLIQQAQLISRCAGLYPESVSVQPDQKVLDIGCGPGEWVVAMARKHPRCDITGIDISQRMIDYACTCLRVHRLSNAHFFVGDVHQPLPFADGSFDLINARFLVTYQTRETWPLFLRECLRLLRPGGTLCSTEVDNLGITNSSALTRYSTLLTTYQRLGNHCFSEEGANIGIQAVQERLLRDSGYVDIDQHMYVINYSSGLPAFSTVVENFATAMPLLQSALLREKLLSPAELDLLHAKVLEEMYRESFCAVWPIQTVWGKKPVLEVA